MHHTCTVKVLECHCELVHDELLMGGIEDPILDGLEDVAL